MRRLIQELKQHSLNGLLGGGCYARFSLVVCSVLSLLIIYSLIVRVQMLSLNTSLWIDEAMLAQSVVGKNTTQMLTPPLVNMQTAPVLYLCIVKLFTVLFGTTEWVLRIYSFIALLLLLVVQGIIMRVMFRTGYMFVFFSVALSSIFYLYMQYSGEFKPYMGDAMLSLATIILYRQYRMRRVNPILLGLIYSVFTLLSTPSAFFVAGVASTELLVSLIRRDRIRILQIAMSAGIFGSVFLANFLFWLRPIASDPGMIVFWSGRQFDFRLWNLASLIHNVKIFLDLFAPLGIGLYPVLLFAVAGGTISIIKRNQYSLSVGISFIMLVCASCLGMYPIQDRLWLFVFAWVFIYAYSFLSWLWVISSNYLRHWRILLSCIVMLSSICLLAPYSSFADFGKGAVWTLRPGNQPNALIEYVKNNIKPGETLFSYHVASPSLKYKIGYDTNIIGNGQSDNILWGIGSPLTYSYGELDFDVNRIIATGGAYVLFDHVYYPFSQDKFAQEMIDRLQNAGFMDLVMDVNHTPLYWFTTQTSRVKASISYDSSNISALQGIISGSLKITNTGSTVLRADGYGSLKIALLGPDEQSKSILTISLPRDMIPGASETVNLSVSGLVPGTYWIDTMCINEYSFQQIGIAPLIINLT